MIWQHKGLIFYFLSVSFLLLCFFWKLNWADGRVALNNQIWIIKKCSSHERTEALGASGEAEFPMSPHTAKSGIICSTPFICCHCGAVGEVAPLTAVAAVTQQDRPPALKCSFHSAHPALGSFPVCCLGLPANPHHPVGLTYFGVAPCV